MKIFAILLSLTLSVSAQDSGDADAGDDSISPVTYQVPVIYEAPVLYQAAVVYYGPVYFYEPPVMAQPERACSAPSTVTYIGGSRGGARIQSNCGSSGSTVVYFGGQQACSQGYAFNRPR